MKDLLWIVPLIAYAFLVSWVLARLLERFVGKERLQSAQPLVRLAGVALILFATWITFRPR